MKSNPGHFKSLLYRGISYKILGNRQKALADFSDARRNGNPCEQLIVDGYVKVFQGNTEEGISLFRKATVQYPKDPIGWHFYGLISCTYLNSSSQDVVTALQKSIESGNEQAGLDYYFLGLIMHSSGQTKQAVHYLREGLKLCPTHTNNYIQLGKVLLEDDQQGEAEILLRKAKELNDTLIEIDILLHKVSLLEKQDDASPQNEC